MGGVLAAAVGRALAAAALLPGDVLLVSSGRTVYEVAQCDLVPLPGMLVAPTVGGNDQPDEWYQTNEITRLVANRIGGRPNYLFAPALPGPDLYPSLINDPSIERVLHLWPNARCALMGIGAPPLMRSDIPQFVPTGSNCLRGAVGDVCSQFYDRADQIDRGQRRSHRGRTRGVTAHPGHHRRGGGRQARLDHRRRPRGIFQPVGDRPVVPAVCEAVP